MFAKNERSILVAALLGFGVIYGLLIAGVGSYLIDWGAWQGYIAFMLFQALLIGTSYELIEIILFLFLKPNRLQHSSNLKEFPPVALLMTVCDDADVEAMNRLNRQIYPNYHAFVLDDSSNPENQLAIDDSGIRVVRRRRRDSFKAGNLNNWINEFGRDYKYVVVFDNDSYADEDFITRLVEYAEHPQNRSVGIFQSKVFPWRAKTAFEYLIGLSMPVRMWMLEHTADQMSTVFCFGHNYLVRTNALWDVGLYPENVTAEDTALTLVLNASGYATRLVDVVSFAAEPRDAFAYSQRTMRWAKQTVELFRFPWDFSSAALKLTLGYHLYTYLIQPVYMFSMLFFSWAFAAPGLGITQLVDYFWSVEVYRSIGFIFFILVLGLWLVILAFRLALIKITNVSWMDIFRHSLLMSSVWYFQVYPMIEGLLHTIRGEKVIFQPTNRNDRTHCPSKLGDYLHYARIPMLTSLLVLLGCLVRNRLALYGVSTIWLILMTASPILLWSSSHILTLKSPKACGDVE